MTFIQGGSRPKVRAPVSPPTKSKAYTEFKGSAVPKKAAGNGLGTGAKFELWDAYRCHTVHNAFCSSATVDIKARGYT